MVHLKCFLLFLFLACCSGYNIVLFLTDDQDIVLGGLNPMQNVQQFIANNGVTFSNSYTASPICCPSRASILTGLYPHNHFTYNNSVDGGCYGCNWKRKIESNTFATILKKAGYNTFYAGKYLNQYGMEETGGPSKVPPGWSEWHGLVGNSVYYDYTISNDGIPTKSTDIYLTDLIRNMAVNYVESQTDSTPFLMVLAPPAPHQPFTPARRHAGRFSNHTVERHPNFNVPADRNLSSSSKINAPNIPIIQDPRAILIFTQMKPQDKHWLIRMPPSPLPETTIPELDRVYRSRWESLLAVDEMVADIVNVLDTKNLLDNTYLIFTSDNGYHIGQFSQVYDKRQPYETDIKVPLIISGPNMSKNVTNPTPTINVDLAPTIISLAGLKPPHSMDGHVIDLFGDKEAEEIKDRQMLVEYFGEGHKNTVDQECPWKYDDINLSECYPIYDCKCQDSRNNTYGCIRHIGSNVNSKYCRFYDGQNFEEIYDLEEDPYELTNIVNDVLPATRLWYRLQLKYMMICRGAKDCDRPLLGF